MKKIYCVGTLAADFYISATGSEYYVGGIASNVSLGLANFGFDTTLLTRIGNDTLGEILINKLNEGGVKLLDKYSQKPTPLILVQKDQLGEISYITHLKDTSYAELYLTDFPSEIMTNSDESILILNGTILQNISVHSWLPNYISNFKNNGGLVVFDINWRDHLDKTYYHILLNILQKSDIIKGTPKEFSLLEETQPDVLISQYFNEKICLLTKGPMGCEVFYKGNSISQKPIKAEQIIDPSGCGDAFVVGFLAGFINITNDNNFENIDIEKLSKCAHIGNYMASQIIQRKGANNYQDIENNLDTLLK